MPDTSDQQGFTNSEGSTITAQQINEAGFFNANDAVAASFWIISYAMIACTIFLLKEALYVKSHWKTSLHVSSLVTLTAGIHYMYMRQYWVKFLWAPIVYRYVDWSITVPLQMIEFYMILNAVNPNTSKAIFWRLYLGTVCMLVFGYLGESGSMNAWAGFWLGMVGWAYILFEVFFGEAAQLVHKAHRVNKHIKASFNAMRLIVTVGWSIYPLGYLFGFLLQQYGDSPRNLDLNIPGDLVNKIAFCIAIWYAGKMDTMDSLNNQGH